MKNTMIFTSHYQTDVPVADVPTYVFGIIYEASLEHFIHRLLIQFIATLASQSNSFIFVDAKGSSLWLCESGLETSVKRLAGGLRRTLNLRDGDVVLAYTENSVSGCKNDDLCINTTAYCFRYGIRSLY